MVNFDKVKGRDFEFDSRLNEPYWTNVNVYYDFTSQQDFVVLVYKDLYWERRVPIVRI